MKGTEDLPRILSSCCEEAGSEIIPPFLDPIKMENVEPTNLQTNQRDSSVASQCYLPDEAMHRKSRIGVLYDMAPKEYEYTARLEYVAMYD